jgi:threonine/homoserine/homoserine lactone efflux protein
MFNGTLWCLVVAIAAARAAGHARRSSVVVAWINRGVGALLVYLGARIAFYEAMKIS